MKIILLRHAESVANAEGIIDSKLPGTDLTANGIRHINDIRPAVQAFLRKGISKCYCSPFQRAVKTFDLLDLDIPLVLDERLREVDYGQHNGRKLKEIFGEIATIFQRAKKGEDVRTRFGDNGENYLELVTRIQSFLIDLLERDENVLVISHESILIEIHKTWEKLYRPIPGKDMRNDYKKPSSLKFTSKDIVKIIQEEKKLTFDDYLVSIHRDVLASDKLIKNTIKEATGSKIENMKRIIAGEISEVYDVTLDSNQHIILKIAKNASDHYERERWAFEHCQKIDGIPIPEILLIRHLQIKRDVLSLCVEKVVEGKTLKEVFRFCKFEEERKRKIINRAGEILSKIHSIQAGSFGYIKTYGTTPYTSFPELMHQYFTKIDTYRRIATEVGIHQKDMQKVFEILAQKADTNHKLVPILNHNDYTLDHIMIDERDEIVGIIDWGEIQGHSPLNDFAKWDYWCSETAPTKWLRDGYENQSLFVDSYEDTLHCFRLNIGLGVLSWYFDRGYSVGIERAKNELLKDLRYFQ